MFAEQKFAQLRTNKVRRNSPRYVREAKVRPIKNQQGSTKTPNNVREANVRPVKNQLGSTNNPHYVREANVRPMGDLAANGPAWWRWAYLGFWQSSSQLQMISPTLARWRWAYLGSAMFKPAKVRPIKNGLWRRHSGPFGAERRHYG